MHSAGKTASSIDCWENWTTLGGRVKLDHSLTSHTRMESEWSQDSRVATIKLLK